MKDTFMEDSTATKFRLFVLVCIVAGIIATGCTGKRSEKELKAIAITEGTLDSDLRIIQTIKP